RRRGDAKGARELAARALAADTASAPDPVAALARIEADLGAFDEARALARKLVAIEEKGPPVIDAFRVRQVEAHIRAREARER
ncbi:MAG: hypothetical protein ACAI25_19910, partial [Planctomycetota bacterium]